MLFDHAEFDGHERVTFVEDTTVGLRAINAIHLVRYGIAGGGVRFRPYETDDAALTDVLRLSKAMTYKMALADLPVGGGKTVVIGDPAVDKTPELLRSLGRFIDSFDGRYLAGPDVGTNEDDMEIISETTDRVVGRSSGVGSTAPPTAFGVYQGIRAVARSVLGVDSLDGRSVAVQGVGGVGHELVRLLVDAGAAVTAADVDVEAVDAVVRTYGVARADADDILATAVDILSPNAIGGVLNAGTIPRIRAAAICGSANNQLATPDDAPRLAAHGIVWAPDYVVSAGGAIAGTCASGHITEIERDMKLAAMYDTTLEILERAAAADRLPHDVAMDVARERIAAT